MTSLKLLIISFTLTLLALITISPAIAKPSVNIQHLQVNDLTIPHQNSNAIAITNQVINSLPTYYSNNFSTGLILSSSDTSVEHSAEVAMTVVNKSNNLFTSTMVVSDKLNQIFSFFSSSNETSFAEPITQAPKNKDIKVKCKNSFSFS